MTRSPTAPKRRNLPGFSDAQSEALEVALLVAFVLLWTWIFSLSPLSGEDFAMTRLDHSGGALERLHWILTRGRHEWLTWSARLGEQLSIVWLELPKYLLDTATALVTLAFVSVVSYFSRRPLKGSNGVLAMVSIYALLILIWPRLEIFFWRNSATIYLQPLLLCLLLVLLISTPASRALLPSSLGFALALPLALLAGASFEHVGPALMLFVFLETRRQGLVPWRAGPLTLLLALLVGWLSVILSPSTVLRAAATGGFGGSSPLVILRAFCITSGPLLLAFIAALALHLRRRGPADAGFADLAPLGWASLFSMLPLLRAPYIQPRVFWMIWVVMLIVIVRTLLQYVSPRYLHLLAIVAITFTVSVAGLYYSYNLKASARDAWIRSQLGTPACKQGIPVAPIQSEAMSRLLNLREDWYFYKPDGVSPEVEAYYGCKLLRQRKT